MNYLNGLTVLILGLGDSGLAMARWCARCGANVRVADTRQAPPQAPQLAQDVPAATLHHGLDASLLDGVNLVLKSPGLAPNDANVQPLLARADELGLPVRGELSLFASALADLKAERGYAPKVLAITGTNGKTTTTSLTAQLAERAGKRVGLAGNIGPTMLQTLAEALDAAAREEEPQALPEVWVLELSSFQLDEAKGFEPDAATVLNITEDHLDWHGSMAAYVAAKARVFGKDAVMVINRDDAAVEKLVPEPIPQKGRNGKPALVQPQVLHFGLTAPAQPGDFGLVVENGMAWLVRALPADEAIKRRRDEEAPELHLQRLMPAEALRLRGRHNAANALAALALASAIGCALAPMLHGLREYAGEPHRVVFVATVGGVDAFDDSKGTNVGATVAALSGLGADRRIVLILGGEGKGQDFSPLATPVARYARAVVLIGRDAPQIRSALSDTGVALIDAPDLPQAVALATQRAHAGDAVLMSPACASFDMFKDYEHRAHVFCDTVRSLAQDAGQTLEGE